MKLQTLIENYCKAANALSDYQRELGFVPGAKVICRFREEPEKKGVIAPYGEAWSRNTIQFNVPVLLDGGRLQPWSMADLTILTEESEADSVSDGGSPITPPLTKNPEL